MTSPVKSPDQARNTDLDPQTPDDAACLEGMETRILAAQVRQLYELGKSGSVSMFFAIVLLWLPFSPHVARWTLVPPLLMQTVAQLSFNLLRRRFERDFKDEEEADLWGTRYAYVTLLSGSTWAIAAVLWLPFAPFPEQALFAIAIAAFSLHTCFSRHVYLRAMTTYVTTISLPTIATLAIAGGLEAKVTAGLGLLLWAAATANARKLHRTSRETFALRFEKEDLVGRLSEAKAVAEQKAADAERAHALARKADRARRDFLSMVTHEIRSPLASLSGLAQQLEGSATDPKQKTYARGVQESSRLLERLVDDLADLTAMESLSIKLRPVDVSPADIASSAVHVMRHEASEKRLSIEFDELPGTPPTIHNDPDRIKQALVNLIGRAIRMTETGGIVVRVSAVHIGDQGPGVRFSVTDTSAGMPTQEAARLFSSVDYGDDQEHAHRRDVNLTICERLVRLMKGRVGADSAVGGGFTAWFVLACAAPNRRPIPHHTNEVSRHLGQVLDLDRVYELEQDLGSGRIADHLGEAINAIGDIQKRVADACRRGDIDAIKSAADGLAAEATAIGFTGLAASAARLSENLSKEEEPEGLPETADLMDAQFLSGARALTRAYPALAG